LELSHQACLTFICRTMMLELFICRCFCRLRTDLELRTFAKKKPLKIWSSLGKASANLRIGHCQIASRAWHRRGMVQIRYTSGTHVQAAPSGSTDHQRARSSKLSTPLFIETPTLSLVKSSCLFVKSPFLLGQSTIFSWVKSALFKAKSQFLKVKSASFLVPSLFACQTHPGDTWAQHPNFRTS
jgi:hypothetical protein